MELTMSAFPEFPDCFVCGSRNPKGLKVPFSRSDDGVAATFTPDQTHVGYEDVVHGGIISALLDEAVIWAAYSATGEFGVTAELNIRFLKPLSLNEQCTVRGKIIQDKRRVWVVESYIENAVGDTLARAEAKVFPGVK